MKKGTTVRIKTDGHRATLIRATNKNSAVAYVWDYDGRIDRAVPVKDIEEPREEKE